ncbi:hypothetical protein NKI48_03150 [Mesorhizobium sp. M0644]|uniref:hypothetical protein n=1 Tax=Mesorhizobium sp. M0644 TaxID=2956979 RepID=UPI0033381251
MAWMDRARSLIAALDAAMPADATIADRKRALRENAWRLHGGTSWGKKVWSKARREYLARHGERPTSDAAVPVKHLSPLERMMAKSAATRGTL